MANSDSPRGLIPVGTLSGAPLSFALVEMAVDSSNATAIFRGDLVKLEDDGNAAPAAAGDSAYGVCMGVVVDPAVAATIHPGYLPATTAGTILVAVGPDVLFEIQEDSDGGSLALTAVGSNVDIIAGAGSTTTGVSAHEIDSSTSTDAAPGSAQLRIVGLVQREDNEVGTNAKWLVRLNENQITTATGL